MFCFVFDTQTRKSWKSHFWPGDLDLWPMTLSIELDQDIIKVNPCTKFRDHTSNRSAVRVLTHGHTHRHTDRTVSITSTAYARGKKDWPLNAQPHILWMPFEKNALGLFLGSDGSKVRASADGQKDGRMLPNVLSPCYAADLSNFYFVSAQYSVVTKILGWFFFQGGETVWRYLLMHLYVLVFGPDIPVYR